ncbi:unnamed protein product [Phaedon cochleariae]|uniref:DALR anticodon binding domain-containing protein n=1 Tax=Phaedon cochleariae TaxID=80249 RepID=A0A9P0DT01_PHACE|nr:unnamed protein product [Phaedon cochleariae]
MCFALEEMTILENFIYLLQKFLITNSENDHKIIRKHTKRLQQSGDISFPLDIRNWYHLLDKQLLNDGMVNIFDYGMPGIDVDKQIIQLKEESTNWSIHIDKIVVENNEAFLFLERSQELLRNVIEQVIECGHSYSSSKVIERTICLQTHPIIEDHTEVDLSVLRLHLVKEVAKNFINKSTREIPEGSSVVHLLLNPIDDCTVNVLCGPVLNDKGVKSSTAAKDLYRTRSDDMKMMAYHKYHVPAVANQSWNTYFRKLGEASVTIEMLANKPQKPIKITVNDTRSANKGSSFIFYNCARLSALFKEFDKKTATSIYPELPNISDVDFSLLTQPEEWELFYVYIMQYPLVVKSCIRDIEKGFLNPQYLISFLTNLSSVFSVYYRRIRILTNPREHMFAVIHARIFLLKAVQIVFHDALELLNIEPIKEM